MKSIIKDALILFLITIIAGGCLGFVYDITKDPIEQQAVEAQNKAYKEVFMDGDKALAEKFEALSADEIKAANDAVAAAGIEKDDILDVSKALDASGNLVGYVFKVEAKDAFDGTLDFSVGILLDGTVNKLSLLKISETPGLGMKAKTDESFLPRYSNKKVDAFKVVKDGTGASDDTKIDAISGATITSKAITKGTNAAIAAFKAINK